MAAFTMYRLRSGEWKSVPFASIGETNRAKGTLFSDNLCGVQVPLSDDVAILTMDRFDEDEWESLLLYYHQTVRHRPARSEADHSNPSGGCFNC